MALTQQSLVDFQRGLDKQVTNEVLNEYKRMNLCEIRGNIKIIKGSKEEDLGKPIYLTVGDFYNEQGKRLTQVQVREFLYNKALTLINKNKAKMNKHDSNLNYTVFEYEDIKLKGLNKFKGHEGEPLCQANVYYKGKRVGFVSEGDWGGPMVLNIPDKLLELSKRFVEQTGDYENSDDLDIFWTNLITLEEESRKGKILVLIRKESLWYEEDYTVKIPRITKEYIPQIVKIFKEKGTLEGAKRLTIYGKNRDGVYTQVIVEDF